MSAPRLGAVQEVAHARVQARRIFRQGRERARSPADAAAQPAAACRRAALVATAKMLRCTPGKCLHRIGAADTSDRAGL